MTTVLGRWPARAVPHAESAGALRGIAVATVLLLVAGGCSSDHKQTAQWPDEPGTGSCAVTKQADVPATMRDGTVLRADLYRPQTSDHVPVILMRTQYGKSDAQVSEARYRPPDWFASHCYLVVVQDIRGQGTSGGTFSEFTNDQNDGYDSVEWAAALPGSNGKVGMYGSSYVAATQWLAAVTAPPHLVTIVPSNTASDYYDGWTYEGGEFRLGFVQPWAIGLAQTAAENRRDTTTVDALAAAAADRTRWLNFRPFNGLPPLQPADPSVAPWYFDWINHSTRDQFWQRVSIRDRYTKVTVPVLHFEGWYDAFLAGGVQNFTGMVADGGSQQARDNQRLVIGPWDHVDWGRSDSEPAPLLKDIGPVANSPINALMLAWFDHFLKGKEDRDGAVVAPGHPRVDYFLMGANVWKSASAWPLPQTRPTIYYLSGSAGLADRAGRLVPTAPIAEPSDVFTYDPRFPAPSLGGHSCCGAQTGPQGPYDQTPVEQRSDVLVYTSAPVERDTEVTGSPSVDLWAQSSATDTDFTAKLEVVKPDGQVINLNNGILRTPFRDALEHPSPTVPGRPYEYHIEVWPTSYEFRGGDRIRLEISSSDYPQFAPNPNTGGPFGQTINTAVATQIILHDAAHPSSVTIPVVPS